MSILRGDSLNSLQVVVLANSAEERAAMTVLRSKIEIGESCHIIAAEMSDV